MSASDKATLSSRIMATITAGPRTIYPYDATLDDVYLRAKERGAAMVVPGAQRRALR